MDATTSVLDHSPRRPVVLVVTAEPDSKPGIKKHLRGGHFDCVELTDATEALRHLSFERVVGAIVDLHHPRGFQLLEDLRLEDSRMPLLALSREANAESINRAQLLSADYVIRRKCRPNLRQFTRKVAAHAACNQVNLSQTLSQYAAVKGLSSREIQVLAAAASGIPRIHICRSLGCSENTVKYYIRTLLAKTGMSSLADVVWWLRSYDQLYAEPANEAQAQ